MDATTQNDGPAAAVKQLTTPTTTLGVILIVLGVLAIASPLLSGVAIALLLGGLILIYGVMRLLYAFKATDWGTGVVRFLSGGISIVCGALVLAHPLLGLSFLSLLLGIFFVAEGISKLALSLQLRPRRGWVWTLLDGLIAFVLAAVILSEWPISGTWVIGLLVGINMLFSGLAVVMLADKVRTAAADAA